MKTFLNTIRWQLITDKRQYLMTFLGFTIGLFCMLSLMTGLVWGYSTGYTPLNADGVLFSTLMAMWIFVTIMLSGVCANINNKQRRQNYIMLPASLQQKFWARISTTVIMAIIIAVLALVVADVLQLIISAITINKVSSATVIFFSSMGSIFGIVSISGYEESVSIGTQLMFFWSTMMLLMWQMSFYILGGFFFRRWAFVLTSLVGMFLWTTFSILFMGAILWLIGNVSDVEIEFLYGKVFNGTLGITLLSIPFTSLNLWLSYVIFRRMSIEGNRWINL